jgi:hypothetical protein
MPVADQLADRPVTVTIGESPTGFDSVEPHRSCSDVMAGDLLL